MQKMTLMKHFNVIQGNNIISNAKQERKLKCIKALTQQQKTSILKGTETFIIMQVDKDKWVMQSIWTIVS